MSPSAHKKRQQKLRAEKYAKGSKASGSNASAAATSGSTPVPVYPPRPASPRTVQRWRDEYPKRHQAYIDYMRSGIAKPRVVIKTPPWKEDPTLRYSYEARMDWCEKHLSPEDEEVRKWREWQEQYYRLGYSDPEKQRKVREQEDYDLAILEMERF